MTMLERVARAIAEVEMGVASDDDFFREHAIAAVKAMREPDNAMLHEAAKALSPGRRPTPERVSVKQKHAIRYRAMIDSILATQPQEQER